MSGLITGGLGSGGSPTFATLGLSGVSSGGGGGGAFNAIAAAVLGPRAVRLTFNVPPQAYNPTLVSDGLRPANYSFAGPAIATPALVVPVTGDPYSLDVYVAARFAAGAWQITIASTILSVTGGALAAPYQFSFTTQVSPTSTPVSGGAQNEGLLRRFFNPALQGDSWDDLIAAVEGDDDNLIGDAYVNDFVRRAAAQTSAATASGAYLDQRAADQGVRRPPDVGMDDDDFRTLVRHLGTNRVTTNAVEDVLETFYGADAVRATLPAGPTEPYAMRDGDDLVLEFGDERTITITFSASRFDNIGQATAIEVAAVLNRTFRDSALHAFAGTEADPTTGASRVIIYADARGLASVCRCLGGRAQVALRLPLDVLPSVSSPYGSWIIAPSPVVGRLRLTTSAPSAYDLLKVRVGDLALIYGREFPLAIQGTAAVLDVSVTYPGGVLTQWIEIAGSGVSATVSQLTSDAVLFLRPRHRTVYDEASPAYVATTATGMRVALPATTLVVLRENGTAGYLAAATGLAVNSVDRDASGRVTLTLASNHGLAVGQQVIVDGLRAGAAAPAVSAGSPSGTLGASHT